ncbi:MAG: hypothetical protein QOJ68_2816, partial [Blastococcus sp.]|nr:hypothetical protein [Blastococcus sp.]
VQSGDGLLRVAVRDDGRGGADISGGSGLVGLRDRVEALGGRFAMHSPPGAGTDVQVVLPLTIPGEPWPSAQITGPPDPDDDPGHRDDAVVGAEHSGA